jgi:hypothetical protein
LSRRGDPIAESVAALWPSRDTESLGDSSVPDVAAHGSAAIAVPSPPPDRSVTGPLAEPTPSIPPVPSTGSPPPVPVGGRKPTWCIALAVRLVTTVKLSIRSVPRALAVVFESLTGHPEVAPMSATTVRCWLMRLGLWALLRPLPRGDDWAYLIDHTVQIGTVKCFAVVGLRLSEWPDRCLGHGDVRLIELSPMGHSTAATVQQALERAARRTGSPRLIVSDQGGDVLGGIDRYCRDHTGTVATCDAAHKGASQLRRALEADARWAEFVARLGQTKATLQQTPLACCIGPRLRPKARFMNLAAPLRWARWCLRLLDRSLAEGWPLTDRQQAVLEGIDAAELEAKLGWLRGYREAVEEWSQWHEVIQVVVRHVRRHGIDRDTVTELRQPLDAMELGVSGRKMAEAMLGFVADPAWVARLGGERLIGSTEILESIFGDLKGLQGQQSDSGVTGLMLVLGALASPWAPEEIERALEATPWKAVESWVEDQIGMTVQSRRRTLQAIFSDA